MSYPVPQQQVIYQQVVRPPSNGFAIAGLILGIVAIVIGFWVILPFIGIMFGFFSTVPATLAVIFGHIGLSRSRSVGIGRGQSLTGLILGYTTLGLTVATVVFWAVALVITSASNLVGHCGRPFQRWKRAVSELWRHAPPVGSVGITGVRA